MNLYVADFSGTFSRILRTPVGTLEELPRSLLEMLFATVRLRLLPLELKREHVQTVLQSINQPIDI